MTGSTITEALPAERQLLQPVPTIQGTFHCVVARRVSRAYLVPFEGRSDSVPLVWVGRIVEVRGTAQQGSYSRMDASSPDKHGTPPRHSCSLPRTTTANRRQPFARRLRSDDARSSSLPRCKARQRRRHSLDS